MHAKIVPVKPYQRKYLEKDVNYSQWESLSSFSQELIEQPIDSTDDLIEFLNKKNELDVIVWEQLTAYSLESYRFVNARDNDPDSKKVEEDIRANYDKADGILMKKILNATYLSDLVNLKPEFRQMILNIQNQNKVHSDKNEAVTARLGELSNQYKKINAQQKVLVNEEEMNLFKASNALKDAPRSERRAIALAVENRRAEDSKRLDEIFSEMVEKRHLMAQQAGYQNYRDFIWDEKSRVDYSPEDCKNACAAIAAHFMPVYKEINEKRKRYLGLKEVYSYDLQLDIGVAPAPVFPQTQEELCSKLNQVFGQIHPDLSEVFDYLVQEDRFDMESRDNKTNAMFSTYFPETRLPFVFYSPVNTIHDVLGPIHESTHAIHAMYTNHQPLQGLQQPGAEVGELFTLAMELISTEYWDVYFEDQQNVIRSRLKKLENCLGLLRMVGLWDVFQNWAYINPDHTVKERNLFWDQLSKRFDIGITPNKPIPAEENTGWQHRPLIYFAPFYMIEYAFAQFGAFEIYRQYRENPNLTINNLIAAMKLGNTCSIQETYKVAGVEFDFSDAYVKKIAEFLSNEYDTLFDQLEI